MNNVVALLTCFVLNAVNSFKGVMSDTEMVVIARAIVEGCK